MLINSSAYNIDELAYPITEMLDFQDKNELRIIEWVKTDTAITIRVEQGGETKSAYFIKTVAKSKRSHPGVRLGIREARFYGFINTFDAHLSAAVPKCLRRHIADDGNRYYLVLEDLSATHQNYQEVDFSEPENWRAPLSALANFHKNFIGTLSQQQIREHTDDEDQIELYIGKLKKSYGLFRDYAQDRLDPSVFSLLESSIPTIRKIELEKQARINENKITTILNRDCHLRNFLYPRVPDASAKIVDWQFWGMGIGTYDLRHLLGSALSGELRKHQRDLVRFYFQELNRGLSLEYSWEVCWEDYRKGVIDNLFMPVWQYAGFGWEFDRWENTLHSAVENYYALDCDEITI